MPLKNPHNVGAMIHIGVVMLNPYKMIWDTKPLVRPLNKPIQGPNKNPDKSKGKLYNVILVASVRTLKTSKMMESAAIILAMQMV